MVLVPMGEIPAPQWRQMLLRVRNITQRDIAEASGEAESTVSRVLAGTYPNRTEKGRATEAKVQGIIADKLGVTVEGIFPLERKAERVAKAEHTERKRARVQARAPAGGNAKKTRPRKK